jgi:hypothetical protein
MEALVGTPIGGAAATQRLASVLLVETRSELLAQCIRLPNDHSAGDPARRRVSASEEDGQLGSTI